jgi:hypothetical protein
LLTAVWQDWGFGLNGKLVLYLENLCLTEKSRIFNPQPRQASERYRSVIGRKNRDRIELKNGGLSVGFEICFVL